jgi:hypothetical protein
MAVEFGSVEWVDLIRSIVTSRISAAALEGVTFSLSEEFTSPPAHLVRHGSPSIGWHLKIADGQISVADVPLDRADVAIVADYATVLPLARLHLHGEEPPPEVAAALRDAAAAGKFRQQGSLDDEPDCLKRINLHDALAAETA